MKTKIFFTVLTFVAMALTSCNDDNKDEKIEPTLYTRLGGIETISKVTDKFLTNVAADDLINSRFEATVGNHYRLQLLRNNLIDQICAGTGGPCQYKGETMLDAHAGMKITAAEFGAFTADLTAALDYYEVAEREKNDLLAILTPMESDIVDK
ncbi:group I truncated hemoglobin [Chryseolinea soli]|uniref:Group 1 truncated hemoglobin n=1 Tax=Chryseolinea soli TaxID=2321403 RepID=A0A385SHU6_9BACT|nr:group 1 truncated hemoglobin [Chryseolinea soli]AYB29495.1 group 1 truncated hemoglobin [Chryseolinea soli]